MTLDIKQINNDISISSKGSGLDTRNNVVTVYDIDLLEDPDLLINRVLRTPLGYLTSFDYNELGQLDISDYSYGDRLYQLLSEPFTTSILAQITGIIMEALSTLPSNYVIQSTNVTSNDIYNVSVEIKYLYNNQPVTSNVSINP